jgi:hypothetical protein
MRVNQNIHPGFTSGEKIRRWEKVEAKFRGEGKGNCITLRLTDQDWGECLLALHYEDDPGGFVEMLKEAIASLPEGVTEIA